MLELVEFLVKELADNKDAVVISLDSNDDKIINVKVAKEDMGKVIGKEGRIAKAIRTIVKAASAKNNDKYSVVILEAE